MTDISRDAVERLAKTADLFSKAMKSWQHKTQKHNEDVRDTLRALLARVEELEQQRTMLARDRSDLLTKTADMAEKSGRRKGLDEAIEKVDETHSEASFFADEHGKQICERIHSKIEALKEQSHD